MNDRKRKLSRIHMLCDEFNLKAYQLPLGLDFFHTKVFLLSFHSFIHSFISFFYSFLFAIKYMKEKKNNNTTHLIFIAFVKERFHNAAEIGILGIF